MKNKILCLIISIISISSHGSENFYQGLYDHLENFNQDSGVRFALYNNSTREQAGNEAHPISVCIYIRDHNCILEKKIQLKELKAQDYGSRVNQVLVTNEEIKKVIQQFVKIAGKDQPDAPRIRIARKNQRIVFMPFYDFLFLSLPIEQNIKVFENENEYKFQAYYQ